MQRYFDLDFELERAITFEKLDMRAAAADVYKAIVNTYPMDWRAWMGMLRCGEYKSSETYHTIQKLLEGRIELLSQCKMEYEMYWRREVDNALMNPKGFFKYNHFGGFDFHLFETVNYDLARRVAICGKYYAQKLNNSLPKVAMYGSDIDSKTITGYVDYNDWKDRNQYAKSAQKKQTMQLFITREVLIRENRREVEQRALCIKALIKEHDKIKQNEFVKDLEVSFALGNSICITSRDLYDGHDSHDWYTPMIAYPLF